MDTTTKEVNILKNRAECINKVHAYINKVAPELIDALAIGFKVTNGYQFFKKDKERFAKILTKYPHFRAYLDVGEYNIWLKADDHYPVKYHGDGGGHTCNYYNQNVYLYNMQDKKAEEFKPLKIVTEQELINAKKRQRELIAQIHGMKTELSGIGYLLGGE